MAQLDPGIILAGRGPDIAGAMQRGNALAQQANDMRQQNALSGYLRDNAGGIMSGDQNALTGLAQYDPSMALNIQTQNRNNARADEQMAWQRERAGRQDQRADEEWRFKVADYARQAGAEEAAAMLGRIEESVKVGLGLPDAGTWDRFMAQTAPDLVGLYDQREALAQRYMDVADILKQQAGPSFRPASPDEAGQYGAQAGQFGKDGRFYPINPPSGMSVETGPDGQVRVTQGAGVTGAAGRPFTAGQSKDNVYATRAEGALSTLDPIAGELASFGQRAAGMDPTGVIRGRAQSDQFQIAKIAGDEFLQAILRKDTGAAITAQEQDLYGKTYLPQPGDSDAAMAQKSQARRRAVEALKSGMSPAQIVAQERALQNSGSGQLPPVDQPQQPEKAAIPDFSGMSDADLDAWIAANGG